MYFRHSNDDKNYKKSIEKAQIANIKKMWVSRDELPSTLKYLKFFSLVEF